MGGWGGGGDGQTASQTDTDTDRHRQKQTETETDRNRDRQTEKASFNLLCGLRAFTANFVSFFTTENYRVRQQRKAKYKIHSTHVTRLTQ